MAGSYGVRTSIERRLSRRRLLATGAVGAAAVFLTACGGSNSDSGAGNDSRKLLTKAKDSSKEAVRGGTLKLSMTADLATWEPHRPVVVNAQGPGAIFANLTERETRPLEPYTGDITGGIAESWEWSPDRLTLTLKLRNDAKFHPVAPVNGRNIDVDDVIASWSRLKRVAGIRGAYANDLNPAAPITSFTATDSRTVTVKLKEPVVYVLGMFCHLSAFPILPKEIDSGYDPRTTIIGSGPVYVSQYTPAVGVTFKRHPGYYKKDLPNIDQIDMPIISESSQVLAQFRAGNIHALTAISGRDAIASKKDIPELDLYLGSMANLGFQTIFGFRSPSPFNDERVRQAYSMSIDRDALFDVLGDTRYLESEGLPIETRWHTSLTADYDGWWLDPRQSGFGENKKYFQHDIAEAKKLMAAAGHSSGLEVTSNHITTSEYGAGYPRYVEVVQGMAADSGFRFKTNVVNYATDFISGIRDVNGKFTGLSHVAGPSPAAANDAVSFLEHYNYSKSSTAQWYGFDAQGKGDGAGDPQVDALLTSAKSEFDAKKRKDLVYEAQRYLAAKQYAVRWPGAANRAEIAWPAVKNFGVFAGDLSYNFWVRYWLDQTKAPFKTR